MANITLDPKTAKAIAAARAKADRDTFCVVYRTGGTANFKWHRTVGMTRDAAVTAMRETERMGYRAMVVNLAQSLAIGLPESYDVNSPIPA